MTQFTEIKPALAPDEALMEANRCLMCYDAPCMRACPTHIDIPGFIKKITTGNLKGSARTIMDSNIFGGSCARVCPTEVLCEGACVLNDLHEKPIKIGQLQRYSTDWLFERDLALYEPGPDQGKLVAIIGGGPAGLSCAAELRKIGYAVTVFDAQPQPGGLNTYGVAQYKMRPEFALREIEWIKKLGMDIRSNVQVGKDIALEQLEKDFDAILVAVGLGEVPPLGLPGEELPGVMEAIDFIAKLKTNPNELRLGRRVAVLGGGNTAIDCVTQAVRLGAEEVSLVYRRGPEDMSAYEHEVDLAKMDGVRFVYHAVPVRIAGSDHVEGLVYQKGKVENGRVVGDPDHEMVLPVDTVIRATGQGAVSLLKSLSGVEMDGKRVVVNHDTMQTANPKYFAAGDCVSGGQEVVNAVAEGKQAAKGIHQFLSKEVRNG